MAGTAAFSGAATFQPGCLRCTGSGCRRDADMLRTLLFFRGRHGWVTRNAQKHTSVGELLTPRSRQLTSATPLSIISAHLVQALHRSSAVPDVTFSCPWTGASCKIPISNPALHSQLSQSCLACRSHLENFIGPMLSEAVRRLCRRKNLHFLISNDP